jgi:hypothetical protein
MPRSLRSQLSAYTQDLGVDIVRREHFSILSEAESPQPGANVHGFPLCTDCEAVPDALTAWHVLRRISTTLDAVVGPARSERLLWLPPRRTPRTSALIWRNAKHNNSAWSLPAEGGDHEATRVHHARSWSELPPNQWAGGVYASQSPAGRRSRRAEPALLPYAERQFGTQPEGHRRSCRRAMSALDARSYQTAR